LLLIDDGNIKPALMPIEIGKISIASLGTNERNWADASQFLHYCAISVDHIN